MITKCECQNCGSSIEFDAAQFERSGETSYRILGQSVECPHCKHQTQLYLKKTNPPLPSSPLGKKLGKKTNRWTIIISLIIIAVLFGLLCVEIYHSPEIIPEIITGGMGIIGSIIVFVIGCLLFVLAVFWLIFPWMVYSLLKKIHAELEKIESNTRI